MTRGDRSKLLYVVVLVALIWAAVAIGWLFDFRPVPLLVVGLLLFIPGRLPTLMWREFYEGRRALGAGDYGTAEARFRAFVDKVRERPWLKRLLYLKWSFYTWDVEAMALNSLGSTFIEQGAPEKAVEWLQAAVELDPGYGVPYANLALVEFARGNDAEAERLLDRAHELGYRNMPHDVARERATVLRSLAKPAE